VKAAHQSGEHEVNLSIFGGNYTVDFETMQQINDDTGTARHVQRKVNALAVTSTGDETRCVNISFTVTLLTLLCWTIFHHAHCGSCECGFGECAVFVKIDPTILAMDVFLI